jgi:hypothetical protein
MKGFRCLPLLLAVSTASFAAGTGPGEAPKHKCGVGPVVKRFGGTDWLVYSCEDKNPLVIVAAPGNPAMPFYFLYLRSAKGYELYGEGTGDKRLTDAAVSDLKGVGEVQIALLLEETQKVSIQK